MDEFKQRQRAMWAAGDYAMFSEYIRHVGEHLAERTYVESGMRGPGRRLRYRQRRDSGRARARW